MTLKNKRMEIQVKSNLDFDEIEDYDDMDEEELVQLYYALEISKNNISKLNKNQEKTEKETKVISHII